MPLIVRAPMKPASVGATTTVRAELVDLFRTLVDLAGLDASAIQADVQGMSLAPLFDAPLAPPPELAAKPAFSQIGSCACKVYTKGTWSGQECNVGRCFQTNVSSPSWDFMGYSMLTADGWRYTVWVPMDHATSRVDWTRPTFDELYNQTQDKGESFDFAEYSNNVAPQFPAKVNEYRAFMQAAVESWY